MSDDIILSLCFVRWNSSDHRVIPLNTFWVICKIKTLAVAVAPGNSSLIQKTPTLEVAWLVPVRTGNLDTLIQTQKKMRSRKKTKLVP